MSLKRALVVDDSRVARITLKKQLETYNLQVELAESAEEAIELLKTHMVDVIFMDHVMPGMDGLEAVSLIKSNPLTATIPVMMYTSKEGEVYVSEARALGAVGVLPKEVQPGVLFNMLLKLGLVRDRRSGDREETDEQPAEDFVERRGRESAQAPAGFEVSALMTRILEDQRHELRSDIRISYRQFARQIAEDVNEQLREHLEFEKVQNELDRQRSTGWQILSAVLALSTMLFFVLFLQARSELDDATTELADTGRELDRARRLAGAPPRAPDDQANGILSEAELTYRLQLDSIIRDMNESGTIPFEERPFNDERVDKITDLLWRLSEAGFTGTLRVESYLGEFCLVSNNAGIYQLQDADEPFTSCSLIGHPLDDSRLLSERQTPSFALFRDTSPLLGDSGIELEIGVRDRTTSFPRVPYPVDPVTAGDWNRVAAQNNRLEYSLETSGSD